MVEAGSSDFKCEALSRGSSLTIYFVKPNDSCRGYKFDRLYYQGDFNEEETARMIASKSYLYPMVLD